MIFLENCLLTDKSHEISYLIFFRKLRKMSQNLSSAAVVIGALRVKNKIMKTFAIIMYPFIIGLTTPFQRQIVNLNMF